MFKKRKPMKTTKSILRSLLVLTIAFATISLHNGCSTATVTPDHVHSETHVADDSVPDGVSVHDGWLVRSIYDDQGRRVEAIITRNALVRYNELIRAYRLQFQEEYKVPIAEHDGITQNVLTTIPPQEEIRIDAQHLAYFIRMSRWSKDGKSPDSVWLKLKNAF